MGQVVVLGVRVAQSSEKSHVDAPAWSAWPGGVDSVTAVSELPLLEPGVLDVITQHVNAAQARRVGGILVG